jgi:hypothetical protein
MTDLLNYYADDPRNIEKIKELKKNRKDYLRKLAKEKYIEKVKAKRKVDRIAKIIRLYKDLVPIKTIASRASMKAKKVRQVIKMHYGRPA